MSQKDQILDYLLGELPTELRAALEQEPDVQQAAQEFAAVGLGVGPVPPPPHLRQRLMTSVDHDPFGPFVARLARLLDLGIQRATQLLAEMEQSWQDAPWPGIQWIHLQGGPATAGCDVGFVKVEPGQTFPFHVHGGVERVLVLRGGFTDSDGSVHRAGDTVEQQNAHHFVALPGGPLIYAVVVPGVEFPAP